MSDCGVCLSSGDDGSCEFFDMKHHVARKQHICGECHQPIPIGQRYEYTAGKFDGDFWTQKTCLVCAEIADAFYCDCRTFGELWMSMDEVMSSLNPSCFNKLQTPAAKAELQRRWMKWKGLTV